MRAILYTEKGPADRVLKVDNLPKPEASRGEVLVKLAYSGVNPSDVKGRAGVASKQMEYPFVIPHSDGSGVVEQVGSGVSQEWLEKRVWIHNGQWARQCGTAAEYIALPLQQVALLPDNVSLEVGAALGIPLITAYFAVHHYGDVAGKTVLVSGGAGNVGFYAIQLAKLRGARVVTTVSSPEKAALAAAAGADLVVLYREENVVEKVRAFTGGRGVDIIIEVDAAGNAEQHGALLAFGGSIIIYGSSAAVIPTLFRPMIMAFANIHFFIVYLLSAEQFARTISAVNALLTANALVHQAPDIYSVDQAALAHQKVEGGSSGKVLIQF